MSTEAVADPPTLVMVVAATVPAVRGFAWELYNVKVHKVLFSRDFSVAISIVKHTLSVNMIPNPILVDKTKKHWQYQQNPIFRVGEPRQKLKANLRCFYAIAWSVERRRPFQRSWGVSTPDPILSVRGMTPRAYQGPKKIEKHPQICLRFLLR